MSGVHNLAMLPKRMLGLMVLLIDELEVNTLEEVSDTNMGNQGENLCMWLHCIRSQTMQLLKVAATAAGAVFCVAVL
jgi:hypothetical protein